MSDQTTPTTVSGTPTRDFSDAGTGRSFTKGTSAEFTPGEHHNFLRAGLIEPAKDAAPAPKSGKGA